MLHKYIKCQNELDDLFMSRHLLKGFPGGAGGKEPACQCRRLKRQGLSLGWEDLLEEGMATHSSILA